VKKKEKAQLKDEILKYFVINHDKNISISEVADNFNIEYEIIHALSVELLSEGYIKKQYSINDNYKENFGCNATQKGSYFLNHEGGSTSIHNKYKHNKIWNIAKIIVITLNAIAILLLTYWDVSKNIYSNKSEKILKEKDSIINELKIELNKLDTVEIK